MRICVEEMRICVTTTEKNFKSGTYLYGEKKHPGGLEWNKKNIKFYWDVDVCIC